MKLNSLGRLHINSPIRSIPQKHYVAPLLQQLGGRVEGGLVLEVGCGRGFGAEIIVRRFGGKTVYGVDLDAVMVDQARKRLSHAPEIKILQGDATSLPFEDRTFDAVFDFGAIQQMHRWRRAVREVARVLKPGGKFFFEELGVAHTRWGLQLVTEQGDDPRSNGFARRTFLAALKDVQLDAGTNYITPRLFPLTTGVGDLIGVAHKAPQTPPISAVTPILMPQDIEVLQLQSQGLTDEASARRLGVSGRTFRRKLRSAMDKLGARSRFEAGVLFERHQQAIVQSRSTMPFTKPEHELQVKEPG